MPKLVILGTATNVPDESHENTHMVLVGDHRLVLIDGPANPYSRLLQANLPVDQLSDIIMTHFHPDHVAGIPLLLMALGLSGREEPLKIYGNEHCLKNMQELLVAFEWENWHSFDVDFFVVPDKNLHLLLDVDEFKVFSSPVNHFIPAIGLRIEFKKSGKILAYSGDTAPTESLLGLSQKADILIHEAAGKSAGHSSAAQAGQLATQADVDSLYLVHYPVGGFNYQNLVKEAANFFSGKIKMAEDFDVINF